MRRYQRRSERVDEAILGVYLSGTNTRRLRGAWLRSGPLSKDAVTFSARERQSVREASVVPDFTNAEISPHHV